MDYWDDLNYFEYPSLEAFLDLHQGKTLYYLSTKAPTSYAKMTYEEDSYFLFGKESAGLDESLLKGDLEHAVRIPMVDGTRSLNLSNSVAIVLYEALRQRDFSGLLSEGSFPSVH